MASSSDSRNHLAVTTPHQISKDVLGSENPIPLSPQWLLSKPGESKLGVGVGEGHSTTYSSQGNRSDFMKSSGNSEEVFDTQKKDVSRTSLLDMETGRRDRWRDEERDHAAIHKDRWRDGDKELGDNRKVERWGDDNSAGRHFGEARRGSSDRWTDSGNKDSSYDQRRESKWNTRWGPDDKETDSVREKWTDSGRDGDLSHDKGLSHLSGHGKDDKETEHVRPWRPTSSLIRGRGDPSHHQNQTPNKQGHTFSYGRGRGDTPPPFFAARGRVNPGGSFRSPVSTQSHGNFDKGESGLREPSPLQYSRTKLLDVYRKTDIRTCQGSFVQVPSLTSEAPSEPLALCTPDHEEMVVLKGIDKGDIVSSGAPQVSKDGVTGRNATEFSQSRRIKPAGSRDDLLHPVDDNKDDSGSMSKAQVDKAFQENSSHFRKAEEISINRESNLHGNNSGQSVTAWRAPSLGERSNRTMNGLKETSVDMRPRNADASWSQTKDSANRWENELMNSSYAKDESRWQTSEDPIIKRQLSAAFDREQEARKLPAPTPEELSLIYRDPRGQIQGPFSGGDIIGWFEAGYFGIELPVRLANAPNESPFSSLGDVMPHLRAKAGPPPGFGGAKPAESVDTAGRPNFGGAGKVHPSVSEVDMMRSDPRLRLGSSTEAENKFLESLMAGGMKNSAQGIPGYMVNNSGGVPLSGVDSATDVYLLAKKLALERQRSLPKPYSYFPGRETPIMGSKSEAVSDSPVPHGNLLSAITDNTHQPPHSQSADLMSVLQGLADRSTPINNGVPGWPNIPAHGSLESHHDKPDLHNAQNYPSQAYMGILQQRLQAPNPPPLSSLIGQTIENYPAGFLPPEKLIASGLSQDPHSLNMLQQQLMLQLQTQAPHTTQQQLQLLDKILLLQKQQKQEEQQQLLRQQQQQQQLLSQVLSEHHSQPRFSEPSYGATGMPAGSSSIDPRFQQLQDSHHISSQVPLINSQEEQSISLTNMPHVAHDAGYGSNSDSSLYLSHQMFGNLSHQTSKGPVLPERIDDVHQKESYPQMDQRSAGAWKTGDSVNVVTNVGVEKEISASVLSSETSEKEILMDKDAIGVEVQSANTVDKQHVEIETGNLEPSVVSQVEVKVADVREGRKTSEKKSRKQKSKQNQSKKSEIEKPDVVETKSEAYVKDNRPEIATTDNIDSQLGESFTPSGFDTETMELKSELISVQSGQAWKPAPGFRPKSFLEIQQEEQRKAQAQLQAQAEMAVSEISSSVSSMNFSSPWSGVVANTDPKTTKENYGDASIAVSMFGKPEIKGKKSHLHDLLAEEVLAKSSEKQMDVSDSISSSHPPQATTPYSESVDEGNFIDAKESKKSRKKSAKAKGTGSKVSAASPTADVTFGTSPIEKSKSSRITSQEKEILPPVPSGPSLGDFVVWKGAESTNNSSPGPAWSTDSKKSVKPTSLRDILKEQEKKIHSSQSSIPIPTPQKKQPTQASLGSGLSWSGSSPSKAASIHSNSQVPSQSKYKGDDDLFWGPVEQSTQETKQTDAPSLASQNSWGAKNTSGKSISGGVLNRQKSTSGKTNDRTISSSPSVKGRSNAMTKQSEAMGFRDWCQNECSRLLGSKDTSVLEFCLKLSRSEAETLLIENLGSVDRNHEFIDKFLNYKDLLTTDVLDIAFSSSLNNQKMTGFSTGNSNNAGFGEYERGLALPVGVDGSSKAGGGGGGGGKKKGKKGKKVSPSVLGFNVVSNRIMMGEIQTVED